MKIEEVVSSTIMFIVSGLVLIGFTIAWFTSMEYGPTVTGLQAQAVEIGVKVALASGEDAEDVTVLAENDEYASMGLVEFSGVDDGELAPGTYGEVIFYVTPINSYVKTCDIVPMVRLTQDGDTWYPEIEEIGSSGEADSSSTGDESGDDGSNDTGDESGEDGSSDAGDGSSDTGTVDDGTSTEIEVTIENVCKIAQAHIEFYTDKDMTQKVSEDTPIQLTWPKTDKSLGVETGFGSEQKIVIYWKWNYEYPFSDAQLTGDSALSEEAKKELIHTYDEEDMILGNNVSDMRFYFTFTTQ